ncbi:MAG: MATE family efflux transporter [Clostridiales bacterium]|nr:MATE family efflux transporter [Clostridiales bacterium]
MTKDMTSGNAWRQIFFFSLPLLVGNVFQQLYSMVDTIIVGRFVSVKALAAVGSTGAISFLVLGFAMGMTAGFSVIIAQRFGAGDEEGVRKSIGMAIWLSVITMAVLTALAIATARPLLEFMNTPEDIIGDALVYIIIIYGGIGASIYYNLIASIVRALGDSKTPLYFLLFSSGLNIVLDLVLIIFFHMGVAGAGIATVFSQLLAAVLCTIYSVKKFELIRLSRRHMRWNRQLAKAELGVGLPMAFQYSITAVGVMVLQGALNRFGSSVIASYTAASKVEAVVTQPFNALGMAMTTYCGQNVGAGKWDRVRRGMKICTVMCMVTVAVAMAVNIFAGSWCTALFMTEPTKEILSYAQTYLNTIAVFYPALGLLYVYRNGLQGMGDGLFPMLGGLGELLARLAVATVLPGLMGYMGICMASPVAWCAATAVLLARYFIWMHKKQP